VEVARRHLTALEDWLAERTYLTGEDFTVADILMITVLREVRTGTLLGEFPRVSAYRARCEARPAWQRTLDAYGRRLGVAPGRAR
jgi:glutathione S-transferase